jgi:adhesin transport system outer membrane protein
MVQPALAKPLAPELQSLLLEHPLIKSARKQVDAAESSVDAAMGAFFPKLSINGDQGNEKIESISYKPDASMRMGTSGTITPGSTSDLKRRKFSAMIEQNLFAGGRTKAMMNLAEVDFAAQENSYRTTLQSTLLEGIVAYLQVARYQTLIAIAKRNQDTTQRQFNLEDERVQRGGGIAVDVLQAKTRLHMSKERRVFNEQGLRDAIATYRQVFGHEPDLEVVQDIDILALQLPKSLEDALEQSRQFSPAIKESILLSQKSASQMKVESSGYFPTVDLVGTQTHDRNASQSADRRENSMLLKFNWTLFSGLDTVNRSKAADLQHQATLDREVATMRKVDESVRISWNQLVNGKDRQDLLENAGNISFEVMQNRKRLRDAGKETAVNVLDSEVEYFGVLASKVNAMYDTRIGSYRLLAAMGMLTPTTLGLDDKKSGIPAKPLDLRQFTSIDTTADKVGQVPSVQPVVPVAEPAAITTPAAVAESEAPVVKAKKRKKKR